MAQRLGTNCPAVNYFHILHKKDSASGHKVVQRNNL